METKEIEIEWKGKKDKVVIRKLDFVETLELADKYIKFKRVGNRPIEEVSYKDMVINTLLMGIKEAPFEISVESFKSPELISILKVLYQEIELFNAVPEKKK